MLLPMNMNIVVQDGIRFDVRSQFLKSDGECGKTVDVFGVHNSSYVLVDNRKKYLISW